MKPTRLAVRGVLLQDDLIGIMYVNKHDCFLFPGGEVEPHESLEEGLIRELEEETGYKTEIKDHLVQVIYEEEKMIHHNEIYLCEIVDQGSLHKTQLEEDWGINFTWVRPNEVVSFCQNAITKYPNSVIHHSLCHVVEEVLAALKRKGVA